MVRIPAWLERKLQEQFPRVRERERFVRDTLEAALDEEHVPDTDVAADSVGGVLHLFTDGGSRGNPGQAAVGCVLEDPHKGEVLEEHYERIGIQTNNVAEYQALIEGLKLAEKYHPNRLICHLDSELVVRQVNGEYRVRVASLQPMLDEIQELIELFPNVTFVHIPRRDNHRADALVNRALDSLPMPSYEKKNL